MLNAYGATFVNEDSTKATLDDKAVQGLTLRNKLSTSGLTSASLSNAQEPEVFADLQAGRAAFALNWPYVLSAMAIAAAHFERPWNQASVASCLDDLKARHATGMRQ